MSDDFLSADFCYRHKMCLDGQMCDGTGKCSDGYLVFMNTLSHQWRPRFSQSSATKLLRTLTLQTGAFPGSIC